MYQYTRTHTHTHTHTKYRSGYFSYKQDVSVHGIKLYQFILPDDELDNSNQDPGFFPFSPNGVLNLSSVVPNNVPLFASKPHFLGADPGYVNNVTGMNPDEAKHDSFLDVEPLTGVCVCVLIHVYTCMCMSHNVYLKLMCVHLSSIIIQTGAVLKAAKRIQLNVRLQRYSVPEFSSVTEGLMLPVWYASEEGGVTTDLANEFKSAVYTVEYGVDGGVFAAIGLAGEPIGHTVNVLPVHG